jgi:hypothetical protein
MGALDELLPPAARPYSEVILGAGVGALIAHFGHFASMKRGALYGAALGLGVSLLKPRSLWPSYYRGWPGRFYAGQFGSPIVPGYGLNPYSYEYEPSRRWGQDWHQPDWHRYGDEFRGRGWGHHW